MDQVILTLLLENINASRLASDSDGQWDQPPPWVLEGSVRQVSGSFDGELPHEGPRGFPIFSNSEEFNRVEDLESGPNPEKNKDAKTGSSVSPNALAWYRSFRGSNWGIYIRLCGVESIAALVNQDVGNPKSAREIAYKFLLEHEITHFRIDLGVAGCEQVSGLTLWNDWRARQKSGVGYSLLAEAICNSHARGLAPRKARKQLDDWLQKCPPGYKDFGNHRVGAAGRHQSWSSLHAEISNNRLAGLAPYIPRYKALIELVPVYLVIEKFPGGNFDSSKNYFWGAMHVSESDLFLKKMKKSGNSAILYKKWEKVKAMLQSGNLTAGLNLEHYSSETYTARVDKQTRVILKRLGDESWIAEDISQQHDAINRRAAKMA